MFLDTLTATADARGVAEQTRTLTAGVKVSRFAASGDSATASPELRVYVGGVLVDATAAANNDVSEPRGMVVHAGQPITARWSRCSAGAAMVLTIEGEWV